MSVGIREGFEWPEAKVYAKQFTPKSGTTNPATVAECVVSVLNEKLPVYDKSHRFYTPSLAIEHGETTCKVRAYMAHLITSNVKGIKSGVLLEAVQGHGSTFITNGTESAVIDSSYGSNQRNSFYRKYNSKMPEIKSWDKLLEYFRISCRVDGFAWKLDGSDNSSIPDGEVTCASTSPLDQEMVNLDSILMIGDSATRAMGELLWAKQKMVDVAGPDLLSLLGDNTLFPYALTSHPQFC